MIQMTYFSISEVKYTQGTSEEEYINTKGGLVLQHLYVCVHFLKIQVEFSCLGSFPTMASLSTEFDLTGYAACNTSDIDFELENAMVSTVFITFSCQCMLAANFSRDIVLKNFAGSVQLPLPMFSKLTYSYLTTMKPLHIVHTFLTRRYNSD